MRRCRLRVLAVALLSSTLLACSARGPSLPERSYPAPKLTARGTEIGRCSWYGPGFHGKRTASGERFDQNAFSAAHRTLPLGTRIEVTDLATGRTTRVRINDRGPYHRNRVLDVSHAAAKQLGMIGRGVIEVEIRVLDRYAAYPVVQYVVQLGVYRDGREAEGVARRARDRGVNARVRSSPGKTALHRVHVGPFLERSKAAEAARSLREEGFAPVIIEIAPQARSPT